MERDAAEPRTRGRGGARLRHVVTRACCVGVGLVTLGLVFPLEAMGPYDTTRVLEHGKNECRGFRHCISRASAETEVYPDEVALVAVSCPKHHPYVARWDTRQSEHIHARLVGFAGSGITVAAVDVVDAVGAITVFLGCTKDRPPYPELMLSRSAVPSNHEGASRPWP